MLTSSLVMLALILITMIVTSDPIYIFEFEENKNTQDWRIVNDRVMGGLSNGQFTINEDGFGEFSGHVSLDNNGGFSSLRYRMKALDISSYSKIELVLKGDGKRYQFRMKSNTYDRHAYIDYFETNGDWQTVEINLSEMYPTFRGRKLNMPNYPAKQLEELAFLIGNKREETFRLEIKSIRLVN